MNPFDEKSTDDRMTVSQEGLDALESTAKWARFLSILGFIGLGLMVMGSLGMMLAGTMGGRSMRRAFRGSGFGAEAGPIILGLAYLIVAVLYFFPIYYLNAFSNRMLAAVTGRNEIDMNSAFGMLRAHYRFVGIITIVLLSLYLLLLLFGLLVLSMR